MIFANICIVAGVIFAGSAWNDWIFSARHSRNKHSWKELVALVLIVLGIVAGYLAS